MTETLEERVTRVLTHWSAEPFRLPLRPVGQEGEVRPDKPRGFWLSDESDFGWHAWCIGDEWNLGGLAYRTDFMADLSDVLCLWTADAVLDFTRQYRNGDRPNRHAASIDWRSVARQHKGILISPYRHDLRFDLLWYYGWDCASACIWEPDCLTPIPAAAEAHHQERVRGMLK